MKRKEIIKAITEVSESMAGVATAKAVSTKGDVVDMADGLRMSAVALGWARYLLEGDDDIPTDTDGAIEFVCHGFLNIFKDGDAS